MAFNDLNEEKFDELLTIIERNRWDRLRHRSEQEEPTEEVVETDDPELSPDNVKVVLFGAESVFTTSLIEMFRAVTVIAYFNNAESAITFCLDHAVPNIIFDIDPPTDGHLVTDCFASIRMLSSSMRVFVCSGRKQSLEVDYFKIHGANILDKPILRNHVKKFCDQYVI